MIRDLVTLVVSFTVLVSLYRFNIVTSLKRISNLLYQKEIDKELLVETELKYREIFDSIDDAIFVQDAVTGKILEVNASAYKLYGSSKEQLLSSSIEELSANEEGFRQADVLEKIRQAKESKHIKFEWRSKKRDGTVFWSEVHLTYSSLLGNDKVLAVVRDIAERKNLEQNLILARDSAEHSSKLKTAFLQNMSHEIRTPLNAITGFTALLKENDENMDIKTEYIDIIIKSSNQLISVVEDILTASRIQTGQIVINNKPIHLNKLLADLYTIYIQKVFDPKLILKVSTFLPNSDDLIIIDETKLMEILINLLNNALKFTQEGLIDFGYTIREKNLEFYVKDTGSGIKPELQNLIFERFAQADFTLSRNYGGTGLGLSISRSFVELMGGKIWVESEQGKGSAFYFTIPYVPVKQKLTEETSEVYSVPEKNITILIAEDEYFNYLLIKELLKPLNYTIIKAVNGNEAVTLCLQNPEIDLVLMDIKMPDMDGLTALKEIQKIRPNLPIVAQTAYAMEQEKDYFLTQGFADYISKPIQKAELLKIIHQILNKKG